MSPNDLLTRGDLGALRDELLLAIREVVRAPTIGADDYLTIDQVAQATSRNRKTVLKWIHEGKPGLKGAVIKLKAYQFSAGIYHIKRGDLEAYGLASSSPLTKLPKAA